MSVERQVAIVMPARNETESFRSGFVEKVFEEIPSDYEPTVVVAVNNSTPEFIDTVEEIGRNLPNVKVIQMGELAPKTFAYAYLEGMRQSLDDGAQKVVEMDATGAHDPSYIPEFLSALDTAHVALSSRFSPGGGIERYPKQRIAISRGGTLAANMFLGLGGRYPDLTSGYEAFRSAALEDIFDVVPPEEWISVVNGPGHFYQVEMRTYAIWRGNNVQIVPMKWGSDRAKDPNRLPWRTAVDALVDLYALRQRREHVIKEKRGNIYYG